MERSEAAYKILKFILVNSDESENRMVLDETIWTELGIGKSEALKELLAFQAEGLVEGILGQSRLTAKGEIIAKAL